MARSGRRGKRVSQVQFINSMHELFEKAIAPTSSLEDSMNYAQQAEKSLAEVEEGKLRIEPPLTHDRFTALQSRAQDIVNIGQKALSALNETSQARAQTGNTYQGQGSGVKS